MSEYIVDGADLTSIANAIRTKGGTSAQLAFPSGFVSAINAISGGGGGEILYSLPETTVFDGSSVYIDTGIKLMETSVSPFTIEITGVNGASVGSDSPIFHCVTESSSYPGLSIQRYYGGDKSVYGIAGIGSQTATTIPVAENTAFKIVIRRFPPPSGGNPTYYFEYTVDGQRQTLQSFTSSNTSDKNLLIGCYQTTGGTKGRYWSGTLYDFKIISAYMSNDYVNEYLSDS